MRPERVVVDTTVWSLMLRRRGKDLLAADRATVKHLRDLVTSDRAILLGMVRMELLSGIASLSTFDSVQGHMEAFDDDPPDLDDYVRSAVFSNRCRDAGIATSPVDMLICGFAARRDLKILTRDRDFELYAKTLGIQLDRQSFPQTH